MFARSQFGLVFERHQPEAVELPVSRRQVRELKDRLIRDPLRQYRYPTARDDG